MIWQPADDDHDDKHISSTLQSALNLSDTEIECNDCLLLRKWNCIPVFWWLHQRWTVHISFNYGATILYDKTTGIFCRTHSPQNTSSYLTFWRNCINNIFNYVEKCLRSVFSLVLLWTSVTSYFVVGVFSIGIPISYVKYEHVIISVTLGKLSLYISETTANAGCERAKKNSGCINKHRNSISVLFQL